MADVDTNLTATETPTASAAPAATEAVKAPAAAAPAKETPPAATTAADDLDDATTKLELDQMRKRLKEAENAAAKANQAMRAAERAKMSEAEQLAADKLQVEEDRRELAKLKNNVVAEQLFIQGGLTSDSYKDLLPLVVSEDLNETTTRINLIADLVARERLAASVKTRKEILAENEKAVRETPTPPAGDETQNPQAIISAAMQKEFGSRR